MESLFIIKNYVLHTSIVNNEKIMIPLRLIPDNISYNFLGKHRLILIISLLFTLLSLALIGTRGLNLGIDFKGGIVIELRSPSPILLPPLREALSKIQEGEVILQHIGSQKDVILRIGAQAEKNPTAHLDSVKEIIENYCGSDVEYRNIEMVGAQVGHAAIRNGIFALGLAFLGMMIYLWFRFEWQFGISGLIALLHDAILTLGFYSVTGFDFNLSSIAALLTVVGFSINDSVVIYDRIRDTKRKHPSMKMDILINKSINDTLSRTILTSGTTLLSVLALIIMGGSVIAGFAWATFFGILVGTFSSIYVSAPLLLYMKAFTASSYASENYAKDHI